jgi:hypothetical protein
VVHPNVKGITRVTKEETKATKEETKATKEETKATKGETRVMVVEVDLGRSFMIFVGGGTSPVNVGMKHNLGLVATVVVTTRLPTVGNLIRSFKCHQQWLILMKMLGITW